MPFSRGWAGCASSPVVSALNFELRAGSFIAWLVVLLYAAVVAMRRAPSEG
jgi:hypothetical protein